MRLWSVEIDKNILCNKEHDVFVDCGCWSSTKSGVFFTGDRSGGLQVWNCIDKYGEAVLQQNISSVGICSMHVDPSGRCLAAGDRNGDLILVTLSDRLSLPESSELELFKEIVSRETTIQKNLRTRRALDNELLRSLLVENDQQNQGPRHESDLLPKTTTSAQLVLDMAEIERRFMEHVAAATKKTSGATKRAALSNAITTIEQSDDEYSQEGSSDDEGESRTDKEGGTSQMRQIRVDDSLDEPDLSDEDRLRARLTNLVNENLDLDEMYGESSSSGDDEVNESEHCSESGGTQDITNEAEGDGQYDEDFDG